MKKKAGETWDAFKDFVTIPREGMAAARREQLLNELADYEDASPRGHAFSERVGAGANLLALGLSQNLDPRKPPAKLPVSIGAANLAGILAAAITRRRTAKEQAEHDSNPIHHLLNFIPGVGTYNALKRYGRAFAENRDREEERRQARKAKMNGVKERIDAVKPSQEKSASDGMEKQAIAPLALLALIAAGGATAWGLKDYLFGGPKNKAIEGKLQNPWHGLDVQKPKDVRYGRLPKYDGLREPGWYVKNYKSVKPDMDGATVPDRGPKPPPRREYTKPYWQEYYDRQKTDTVW